MTRATKIARGRGHGYVGTEHVLLALLDDEDGIAGGAMHGLGVAEQIRVAVLRVMDSAGYSRASTDMRPGQ